MKAELLTVGDELLIGQVLNTNAAWIGEHLNAAGIDLVRSVVVGDNQERIQSELEYALQTSDLLIITGGLGPTHDDLTREAIAGYLNVEMHLNERVLEHIRQRFARRSRSMPERNKNQAMVPEGFTVLENPVGTAPGLWKSGEVNSKQRTVVVLPGVPHEMKYLFDHEVLPLLRANKGLIAIHHRTLLTTGIGESNLQEKLGDLSQILGPNLRLAYLPSSSGVRLRITAYGTDQEEARKKARVFEDYIRGQIEKYIFGTDLDTLEGVVGEMLKKAGRSLAVAESCTGGHVLDRLTNVSGSSAYVLGGIIAYSNAVKTTFLRVSQETLNTDGAVSEAVALQMAHGIRVALGADLGVSTTGIAGPSGGTPEKPVGTVWIGFSESEMDHAILFNLAEERILNKELASTAVLNMIRRYLMGSDID